jgi:hypothetical protein
MTVPLGIYNHVCIGTSPITLLEALHQANSGKNVLILEAADKVGGAWGDCCVFGLPRAEIAPHVLLFNRDTFNYFEQDLGVRMSRMTPPPRYVMQTPLGPISIPYALSPFVAYFSVPLHYVRNPQFRANFSLVREEYFGRLGSAAKQIFQWAFSRKKPFIEYPVGGTVELIDRIMEKLRERNVEIRLSSRVETIERTEDNSIRVSWNGQESVVSSVSMTRHQRVSRLIANRREVDVEYLPFTYTSIHFLISSTSASESTFILAKRDPIVNLVSDLTSYTPQLPAGKRLIVVRLHGAMDKDETEAKRIFAHLHKGGYIPTDASMDDFAFNIYQQGRMTPESLENIAKAFGEKLRVFRSTNFSNSIGDEIARWRG